MLRNREVHKLLIFQVIISLIAIISGFFFSKKIGWLIFAITLLFILSNFLFTYWRYREIAKLSNYLREISSGNFSLDVRDNYEGELSILKSEIYQVTTLLTENSALLEEDKHKLRTEEHTSELQ